MTIRTKSVRTKSEGPTNVAYEAMLNQKKKTALEGGLPEGFFVKPKIPILHDHLELFTDI
jgi:hypothetical protein